MVHLVGIGAAVVTGIMWGYAKHTARDISAEIKAHYKREYKTRMWKAEPWVATQAQKDIIGPAGLMQIGACLVFFVGCVLYPLLWQ